MTVKTIKVSDMMCSHCKDRIEKGLAAAALSAVVDLETKTVKVEEKDLEKALGVLDDLGFDAKEEA